MSISNVQTFSLILKSFFREEWKAWGGPKGGTESKATNNHVLYSMFCETCLELPQLMFA